MLLTSAPTLRARELDAAAQQVVRAMELLDGARRWSRGRRASGESADERRGLVLALTVQADVALNEARVLLDSLLREAGLDAAAAPRPVIELG